jgi:hypothetical protein
VGGHVLLIVLYGSRVWRIRPGEMFTFGRSPACGLVLPAEDRGVSRLAGTVRHQGGLWWLRNDGSAPLHIVGDRGLRVELPSGVAMPVQQWHTQVRLNGLFGPYTLRLRLPALDDTPDRPARATAPPTGAGMEDRDVTSTRLRLPLNEQDRLVLAARFEDYLTRSPAGVPVPRSARAAARRIGWQPHTVAKRCENIRERYARLGMPGLRGPRALDELATLLISTGELTAADLRRLPAEVQPG